MEVKEIVGIAGGRRKRGNRRIMSFPLLYFSGKSQSAVLGFFLGGGLFGCFL